MARILLFLHALTLILCSGPLMAQIQEPDSPELEKRNGFKDIRLNFPIDSVRGARFVENSIELKTLTTAIYEVEDPGVESIGEVKVHKVTLSTYQGLVYKIEVITDRDQRLMRGLEKAFGKASYSVRTGIYSWRAPSLSLTFDQHRRNQLKLVYKSYPVYRKMKEDKGETVTDIAEDF